jgi:tRNA modification GTPase
MIMDGSQLVGEEDLRIYEEIRKKKHIVAVNKTDLPVKLNLKIDTSLRNIVPVWISIKTGAGLKELEKRIVETILNGSLQAESALVTKVRHKKHLTECSHFVQKARNGFIQKLPLEFIACDLRESLDSLGEILGEIYTDDILDVIFREFCVGK